MSMRNFPDILTWMEDSRPWNLIPRVNLCVESVFELDNIKILHLNLKNEKRTYEDHVLICYVPFLVV